MNNKFSILLATSLLVLSVVSCNTNKNSQESPASASERPARQGRPGGGTPPNFSDLLDQMDANNDLKLSEEEVQGPLKERFSTVDENGDGFITAEEFANMPAPARQGPPGGGRP